MLKSSRFVDSYALAAYTLISMVMTWPLVTGLGKRFLLFGTNDEYVFVWSFWWTRYALQAGHTWPLYTDLLYHPFGTSLALNTNTPLLALLSIPITGAWGAETVYNLWTLLSFILSAFTMYLLVGYLTKSRAAAFLAGVVFAFSTFKFWQATGHLANFSTQFFPLYVLFFIKMLSASANRYRNAAFAGISLGFILLTDYYQLVYALFFSACYLVYYLLGWGEAQSNHHNIRRWRNGTVWLAISKLLAAVGLLFLLVGSPLIYADIAAINDGYYVKLGGETGFYADIASFFVPGRAIVDLSWVRATFADFVRATDRPLTRGGVESQVYAGWTVIVLLVVGTWRLVRRSSPFRFWLAFLLLSFWFALGLQPRFVGIALPIPGIYNLWANIPLLNNARIPARFDLLITFASGVLVGYTTIAIFNALRRHWPRLRSTTVAAIFLIIVTPLMLIEHLTIPLITKGVSLSYPAIYAQIAAEAGDFAVLNLPNYGSGAEARSMYEQTIHQKRILASYIARPLPEFASYYNAEQYLRILSVSPPAAQSPADLPTVLSNTERLAFYRLDAARLVYYLDIKYIVAKPASMPVGAIRFLTATLPLTQVYRDNADESKASTIVYQVDLVAAKARAEVAVIELAAAENRIFRLRGWEDNPREDKATGFSYVQMQGQAAEILAPVREAGNYTITILLRPTRAGQTLSVYLNDEAAAAAVISLAGNGWQEQQVAVSAQHWRVGLNKLRLQVSGDGLGVGRITFTRD